MNTAREILKQADTLRREQAQMEKFSDEICRRINDKDTKWQVSVGSGWFYVPLSVMHAIQYGVTVRLAHLADEIDALEARVLVVES